MYSIPQELVKAASDYVILSPRNYVILSQGQAGDVTFGGDMANSTAIARLSPGGEAPDIGPENLDYSDTGDFQQTKSDTDFIRLNETNKSITIGGGSGDRLGSVFFRDTRNIGGVREFCNEGGCFFDQGIRVFFTLDYTGNGDGFVFALINANSNKNDKASAGGDIERSELLGYSGDSRVNVSGTLFLDNSGPTLTPGGTVVRGLIAPKIGLEFDGKVNYNSDFEKSVDYCSSTANLDDRGTRNDPGATNRDAMQYVFWGDSTLDIECRKQPYCGSSLGCKGDPSYDDNRHNATGPVIPPNWTFNTDWSVNSSPALASDGTIYIGSNSTNFYAIYANGTQKWKLDRSGAWYSPTVAPSGRIYVGSGHPENKLYAINPADGSVIWTFPASGSLSGAVTTKPAVSSDGSAVYFGSQDGFVYAINSSGTELWRFNTGQPVNSSPALSTTGNYIYFGSMLGIFYALRADTGAIFWNTSVGSAFQSSPAIGPDGTVYVGNDNGRLYAFIAGSGDVRWRFTTGEGVQSSPAVSNDGTVVYVGSYDDILYAVYTATGIEKWRFTNAKNDIQGPIAVDANDHIYFGSNDNNVYAVYYDGSEKWHFLTGGDVRGKPAVKGDGSVYVGSYDFKLYAINQFANPKSFKDLLITANRSGSTVRVGGIPVTVDSDDDWFNSSVNSIAGNKRLWAVRMEVTRSQTKVSGTYSYNLRTWMRQCDGTKTDCSEVLGTFYADTRLNYSPSSPTPHPPMMEQTINLLESDHDDFDRFLFGFTSQTATGETQAATIQNFQLSFIRSNDPTISEDPDWP